MILDFIPIFFALLTIILATIVCRRIENEQVVVITGIATFASCALSFITLVIAFQNKHF